MFWRTSRRSDRSARSENATTVAASPAAAACLRLHLIDGIGPVRGRQLIEHFGSASAVLAASGEKLSTAGALPRAQAAALQASQPSDVHRELDEIARLGGRILCLEDPDYPALLRQLPDAPLCVYALGQVEVAALTCLAIVGSRRCTIYGREQAYCLAMAAARCGMVVVSGLARGVDHRAHEAALDCDGPTIAVLACGLARLDEHHNARTAGRILDAGGAVLSEYPLARRALATTFPRRNRIIAGLAVGTVVIEAARHSGALITARLAAEYNREVFAVPGRVDTPTAAGVNGLIQRGEAKLVTSIEDVIAELHHVKLQLRQGYEQRGQKIMSCVKLDPGEQTVLSLLDMHGVGLSRICDASGLPPENIARILVTLQLKGVVEQLPGDRFARLHEQD